MKFIATLDGFDKLDFDQQLEVLNNAKNFLGLSETANKSKGPKTYFDWLKYKAGDIDVDNAFRNSMIIQEKIIERALQGQIDRLNGCL
ncbi:MAG: hypothetical protein K2N73_04345 [Lachnospiraceae bacterium]|nr:hypothetical protein [Lachnospiraceae bacterium]